MVDVHREFRVGADTGQPEAVTRRQEQADALARVRTQADEGHELGKKLLASDRAAFEDKIALLDFASDFLVESAQHKSRNRRYALDLTAQKFFSELPNHPTIFGKGTNHIAAVLGYFLYGDEYDWRSDKAARRMIDRYRLILATAWEEGKKPSELLKVKSLRKIAGASEHFKLDDIVKVRVRRESSETVEQPREEAAAAPAEPPATQAAAVPVRQPSAVADRPPEPQVQPPKSGESIIRTSIAETMRRDHRLPDAVMAEAIESAASIPVQFSATAGKELAARLKQGPFLLVGNYDGERLHVALLYQG
jgi:hypothetical protein